MEKMETQNKMAVMPMRRLIYTMALPLMMSLLVQSLYNIVDSIFVSRLSEQALTATSLVYPVQHLMIAVGVGTAVGLNALLSRLVGQKQPEQACRVATTGLVLMLATTLLFALAGLLFSGSLSRLMTEDAQLQQLCNAYMRICLIWCCGVFVQTYGQRLLQAVGDTLLSMVSLMIGACVNLILDPLLIFGLLGCPALGVRGAAIATVAGQWLSAASALLLNRWKNPVIHVRFRGYRFLWSDVKEIYRVGMPTIVMQAIGSVMNFAVNAVLLPVSSTAVAFFGVYYKLQNFLMMPMNGLGQAAIPIVGYNYGAGNYDRIRAAWKILLPTGLVFSLAATVVFLLFPGQLLSLFAAGGQMRAIGIPALRIVSVTFLCSTWTILCGYFASGLGNGVINMLSAALRQLVLLVPLLWLLLRFAGLPAAWFAFWVAEGAACVYSLLRTRLEMKKKGI